jgi:hypothetical protein
MKMYTIDDMHYNESGVPQVASIVDIELLQQTLQELEQTLKQGSTMDENMLHFFMNEVAHITAYLDNDVNQAEGGPRHLFAVGVLKSGLSQNSLFIRLGISAPDENPLIPSLQALYLKNNAHPHYIAGEPVSVNDDPDRWFYDFTERYGGMLKGAYVRTPEGIDSLGILPRMNKALLLGRGLD